MTAAVAIRRGDTLDLLLEFFTDTDETTPLDFSGSTLSLTDSTFPVSHAPILTVDSYPNGQLRLSMASTDTAQLVSRRNYQLEIKQVQPGGAVRTFGPIVFATSIQ